MIGNDKKIIGYENAIYTNPSDNVVVYTLDAYDQCIDGTPVATQVYSTSATFALNAYIYTDITLTNPYANQIFGSDVSSYPCTTANVGTQTDNDGKIVSITAEIGGCC